MVSRGAGGTLLAELAKDFFHPVVLVYVDWPVTPIRAHTGRGTISWGGNSWAGVWRFGSVTLPPETGGMATARATASIVGQPEEIYAQLDAPIRNRACEMWFGVVSERAGNDLIGTPVSVFSGYMDAARAPIIETETGFEMAMEVEFASGPPARARGSYYHSDADQRRAYPTDSAGRLLISNLARSATLRW